MKSKLQSILLFFLSFFICAFGQPARISFLGIVAAAVGYGLFFISVYDLSKRSKRFLAGLIWFTLVSSVQLSWMISIKYMGMSIILVYFFIILGLGAQFGLLTSLVPKKRDVSFFEIIALASLWTLFEWSRVYFISGFTWNPIGLHLASNSLSMGSAALFGVYGLSFLVMLTNLFGYKAFLRKKAFLFLGLALFPYFFGYLNQVIHDSRNNGDTLSALLVQTALKPEEKEPFQTRESFIPPTEQWYRILSSLKANENRKVDLIVMPEVALPVSAFRNYYYYDTFSAVWREVFQKQAENDFELFRQTGFFDENSDARISNVFWAQSLSDHFGAEVILGLDDYDHEEGKSYNSAFHFRPREKVPSRYEKRVLVPVSEYIPFDWCARVAKRYGISAFFTPGNDAKIFHGKVPISTSICYEETYSDLIREGRINGAKLFVNVTNDGWFPNTNLPKQHFYHGILRSVENGVPVLRAANTGITGGIDSLGRVQKTLEVKGTHPEKIRGCLHVDLPLYSYQTLYSQVGDGFIIGFSMIVFVFYLRRNVLI